MANRFALTCLSALTLQGCVHSSSAPLHEHDLIREGLQGVGSESPTDTPVPIEPVGAEARVEAPALVRQQILRGNRQFVVDLPARATTTPAIEEGQISFNFANQPIAAVINTVLGELLQENYSIAQGVNGEVSFSTARPVDKAQALSILQTLLSWTGNALIRQDGRYWVVPAKLAVAGQMTPQRHAPAPGSGLSARLFTLNYITAVEMHKLLKPFAQESAFLLVDPARNVLVLAGTPEELANYQDTIDTFDLNWLKGMSIGVFNLQRANVAELMPELNRLFGQRGSTPLAGMIRFLPIERTNAVVAISSQPEYLDEIGRWIDTIDQGGGYEPQMYVYDVRNMKASDLARYLRQIYGNEAPSNDGQGQVAPGLRSITLSSQGSLGSLSRDSGLPGAREVIGRSRDAEGNDEQMGAEEPGASTLTSQPGDSQVRITAQRGSNQLLVRCRPTQWREIQAAIRRLDNPPLQVQIETRILEVSLEDGMELGVQWYLGRLAGNADTNGIQNVPGSQGAMGGGGAVLKASDSLFYSFVSSNLQVALRALERSGNTRVLSAPSLVVMNNQSAQIQVGDNIPINQTSINLDNTSVTTSSVQYVQTGVILEVVPRINPGGLVYMEIQQQVSDASTLLDANGNPSISTRSVSTQIAAQSGQTVLLGGLIKQNDTDSRSQVPWVGRIPGLGWLFSNAQRNRERTELIVLITPRMVIDASSARQVTDEYRQQLQLVQPAADGS